MFERDLELEERLGGLFFQATKYGDKAAMETVMGYTLPVLIDRVAYWCDKKGRSRGFAEIVACMTLMKALAKASTFDPERPLMPWLTTIAYRDLIDLQRIEKRLDRRLSSLNGMPVLPAQDDDELNKSRRREILEPIDQLVWREDRAERERQRKRLDATICSLSDLKRQVIELYRAGKSIGLIAVEINLPPSRVSKILFEAKAELRRRIG